ncbi:MAG: helix-turn-helix domain-containing protein [Lachnospiraceae bacterium]|nr:helix-turn-helix domain-containing protein [Lachnospiraceae bacterium]
MACRSKHFGIVLKNARMDRNMTQEELAEELELSLPYVKDLERFRSTPSLKVFTKVMRYFNLSADTVVYPENVTDNSTYQQLNRMLLRCSEGQLQVLMATAEALLDMGKKESAADAPATLEDTVPPAKMNVSE